MIPPLSMPFTLPKLPYEYAALEPAIDAKTMEIHHTKHHQTYIDKLNAAVSGSPWESMQVEDVLRAFKDVPDDKKTAIRNHGGGHANHSLFWTILSPVKSQPSLNLAKHLTEKFGSLNDFQAKFTEKALSVFGSGWAWLTACDGTLEITSTPNQDSPLMEGKTPLLGLDLWEHAYYLKYQNKRPDYVAAFWSIVNWTEVERRLNEAV